MGHGLLLGKNPRHIDKDVELCRTTNDRISNQAAN